MDKGKIETVIKKITVFGIVQGVGFRPLVYRLAKKYAINGTVKNIGGLVEITAKSSKQAFDDFLHSLVNDKDSGYEIVKYEISDIKGQDFDDFRIIQSANLSEVSIIPPDLPVCEKCKDELFSKDDRRFQNPFISCMLCGPRYTIMEKLPYDRENTTMADFEMCQSCLLEYTLPEDRRFHAQTISCFDCGPYLIFGDLEDRQALIRATEILKSGGIIAVKGIGGYHFACSVFFENTVKNLRKLKGREQKPFAVMFENIDSIQEFCEVSDTEKSLLNSRARPIVLLYEKEKKMAPSVSNDSIYCGAFLPYTPLQILLLKACGPLIMTSANISGSPVIKDDDEMLSFDSPYLDGVLYNKRRIVRFVDDSVAKVIDNRPQLIRRSRGYVPYPVFISEGNNKKIFAAGGDLKATFCLYHDSQAVVSQYFGDLEQVQVIEQYKNSVEDLSVLLKIKPEIAVCDMHPNYHSSRFAKSLGLPVLQVQHHHAHVASVMAEHHLNGKIIGVAFDGTGFGTDGAVWGGEFLICEGAEFKRAAHLKYSKILGGDKSMKDAKKTAACYLLQNALEDFVTDERIETIKAAIKNNINTVNSSSMGRLFDAVASILSIGDYNSYEGKCAAALEREAVLALRNGKAPQKLSFEIYDNSGIIKIDAGTLLLELCTNRNLVDVQSAALGFHFAVADMVLRVCQNIREQTGINDIALCGGVFQNSVLTNRALALLRENNFSVYYNISVPPNDGAISLGQTYIGLMR